MAALPDGRRKDGLSRALDSRIVALFEARMLSFDVAAAGAFALIRARAKAAGKAIAAMTAAHAFTIATRDTSPFEAAGLPVINPWTAT
jgi:predicted nucleic acid-binding protein